MSEPARQRRRNAFLVSLRDHEKGRRAGPAIEEFVAAADREIGAHAGKIDWHRAGRMREIPDHQRAPGMRRFGDLRHVVHAAGAIAHMGEQYAGDSIVDDIRKFFGQCGPENVPLIQLADQTFRDIEIGWKIFTLREDDLSCWIECECRRQNLEQIDRGGVRDNRFTFARPDQTPDLGADLRLQIDPAM